MNTFLDILRSFAPPAYVISAVITLLAGFVSAYLSRRLKSSVADSKERASAEKTIATAHRIQEYLANADIEHSHKAVR